jgi:hypothetical protein
METAFGRLRLWELWGQPEELAKVLAPYSTEALEHHVLDLDRTLSGLAAQNCPVPEDQGREYEILRSEIMRRRSAG